MKTLLQFKQERLDSLKQDLLKGRKPYTRKPEKIANSNDFIFDKATLTIIRKKDIQLELL